MIAHHPHRHKTTLFMFVLPILRHLREKSLLYLIVLTLSLAFGFPFFFTLANSLKAASEIYAYPPILIPASPQWINYLLVLETQPYAAWLKNTIFVTLLATSGTVFSSALVAYSFARFKYRGRDLLFLITLATMMLPAQVTLIPQYILFWKIGWLDTLKPLWVPAWFGGAFFIFLIRQFMMTIPRDLDEAALIDGADRFRIFWSILLPLCQPVLATAAIISLMEEWNRFIEPVIYLNSPMKYTLSVGLSFFKDTADMGGQTTQHILMAAAIMMIVPTIVLFFAAQRYFVQGIVMSGLKY